MKFIDKYPPGPRTFTVAPEKEVQPGIFWVDRWYQCVCGIRTPFRMLEMEDSPGVPVCSEECAHQMIADLLTMLGDQTLEAIKAVESPSNSPVDRPLDMGEAVGSTPTSGTNATPPSDQPLLVADDGQHGSDNHLEVGAETTPKAG